MSTVYPDLPAAMIGHLRNTPRVVRDFAEDTTAAATTKFHADAARDGVSLPWAAYEERTADVQYMTRVNGQPAATIETGTVTWTVVAEGKATCRELARLLSQTLNDAPLVFQSGTLMHLRSHGPQSVPVGGLAPNSSNAYAFAVTFDTMVQGTA
jgi:hypothetical protein